MNTPATPPNEPGPATPHARPGGAMRGGIGEGAAPSRSQLQPLSGSAWTELTTKPYFVPSIVVCVAITLLFALQGNRSFGIERVFSRYLPSVLLPGYYILIGTLIVMAGAFAIYRMAGKPKAWWAIPAVFAFTALLTESPVMRALQSMFSAFGPDSMGNSIPSRFVYMVFAAGLPEELLKAVPVALGVWIGVKLVTRLPAAHPARQLAVLEPLDAILLGAASGFGFAFSETVLGYMARAMVVQPDVLVGMVAALNQAGYKVNMQALGPDLFVAIVKVYDGMVKALGEGRAFGLYRQIVANNQGAGLELMIPRLVSEVFGHAAYAGVFGYFIGLAMIKPGQRAKTLAIGLAAAVLLHAAWNAAAGASVLFMFLITVAGFVMLAVCIIKARQMSPERSQLVASQLIDRFGGAPRAATPAAMPMPMATPAPAPAPAPAAAVPPVPAVKSMTWDDDSSLRTLEIGTARIPASVGARLWERQAPGAQAMRGDGVVAEVSASPQDPAVLGLKNLSTQTWPVTLANGVQRELASGRSIRLEAGMQIRIGELTATVR